MERKVQVTPINVLPFHTKPINQLSPLSPLKSFMRWTRLVGGFPLLTDREVKTFKFSTSSYIGMLVASFVLMGGYFSLYIIIMAFGSTIFEVFEGLTDLGFDTTAVIVLNMSLLPNTFSVIFYNGLYAVAASHLTDFCDKFCQLSYIVFTSAETKKPFRFLGVKLCIFIVLALGGALLSTSTFSIVLTRSGKIPSMWICLLEIVFVLTIVSSYLPPVALISHYIVVQGIEMVALAVKKFSVVARHHHDKDGTLAISVGDIIELSEEIAALVKSADSCFGPPLILEFTICIVSLVAGLYFVLIAVSIVGSAEGSFHPKAIYLSLSCVGMGFMGLLRLISLIWSGQKFSDQMTLAREQLQDVAIEYHAILSSVESAKLAVMLDRLDKYRNLRPWDGFNLNFSMGLSLIGLLLTYLIVLIQFSLAEN